MRVRAVLTNLSWPRHFFYENVPGMSCPSMRPEGAPLPIPIALPTSRRSFMSASLLTASGLFAATSTTQALSLFSGRSNLDTSKLPSEWVRRQGAELHAYARYLSSLRLKHIPVQEVIAAHAKRKGSVWNTLPPRSAWRHMSQTLRVADEISSRLGTSVRPVKP